MGKRYNEVDVIRWHKDTKVGGALTSLKRLVMMSRLVVTLPTLYNSNAW